MSLKFARGRIASAKRQLERVQSAESASDPENAVMWAFYSYENCVTALAEAYGLTWTRNHREKAQLARQLYTDGNISRDVGDHLEELNRLRKDVAYELPGLELEDLDLEDLASQLEEFIVEIESRLGSMK